MASGAVLRDIVGYKFIPNLPVLHLKTVRQMDWRRGDDRTNGRLVAGNYGFT